MEVWALATNAKALDDISKLINQGRRRRALKAMCDPEFQAQHEHTAHYWNMLALCQLLRNQLPAARRSYARARTCSDFAVELTDDYLRDRALYLIRRRRGLKRADSLLQQAASSHQEGDRAAVYQMCWGRLEAAKRNWTAAILYYQKAQELWNSLTNPNQQWIMNNRFHWLKALAVTNKDTSDLANLIIATDPSPTRQWRARLIKQWGRFSNRVDDLAAWFLHL